MLPIPKCVMIPMGPRTWLLSRIHPGKNCGRIEAHTAGYLPYQANHKSSHENITTNSYSNLALKCFCYKIHKIFRPPNVIYGLHQTGSRDTVLIFGGNWLPVRPFFQSLQGISEVPGSLVSTISSASRWQSRFWRALTFYWGNDTQ